MPVDLKETRPANGLRVITVEDHSTPVIAIDITYNVGSRNERPGRTGFAHLFEHMILGAIPNLTQPELTEFQSRAILRKIDGLPYCWRKRA
jgi:zinc protease